MYGEMENSINILMKTGRCVMGTREVRKFIEENGIKMAIFSRGAEQDLTSLCKEKGIIVIRYNKTSMDLGMLCRKPFPVSVLGVIDEGDSGILSIKGED